MNIDNDLAEYDIVDSDKGDVASYKLLAVLNEMREEIASIIHKSNVATNNDFDELVRVCREINEDSGCRYSMGGDLADRLSVILARHTS